MKAASPFQPSPSVKRRETDVQSAFAARHFAARRAGFLLRELARQQQELEVTPILEDVQEAIIEPAENFEATLEAERHAEQQRQAEALQEAYHRGRAEAFAELAQGLDQGILALDAAARALAERQARLERELIVPLAKAGVDIGAQLARQALSTPEGLAQYLGSVQDALRDREDESVMITAHLHPDDVALLDRGQAKPQHLRLLADPLVSPGGVLLSATDQVIDDRFESRLREVREAALGAAADVLRLAPALEAPAAAIPEVTVAPDLVVPELSLEAPDLEAAELSLDEEVPDMQLDADIPDLTDDDAPADFIE